MQQNQLTYVRTAPNVRIVQRPQQTNQISQTEQMYQHHSYRCDSCGVDPIVGLRWVCLDCVGEESTDLCDWCKNANPPFQNARHKSNHRLAVVKPMLTVQQQIPQQIQQQQQQQHHIQSPPLQIHYSQTQQTHQQQQQQQQHHFINNTQSMVNSIMHVNNNNNNLNLQNSMNNNNNNNLVAPYDLPYHFDDATNYLHSSFQ